MRAELLRETRSRRVQHERAQRRLGKYAPL